MTFRPEFRTLFLVIFLLLPSAAHGGDEHGHDHGEEEHGHGGEHEHGEEESPHLTVDRFLEHGIVLARASEATLNVPLRLTGRLLPNENKVAHMAPRFPGVVREVKKTIGDRVEKGEVVAVVESNQSLTLYEIRAFLSGHVTQRHASLGEFVGESSNLLEIADLSELFADLYVFPEDFAKVRVGQKVKLTLPGSAEPVLAQITFVSPLIDASTQSRIARAVLPNSEGRYQPGGFVAGQVVLDEIRVPVAVRKDALQTVEGKNVLFIREGESFEPRPVKTGRSDDELVEILSGIKAGEQYAAGNTFLLKAEAGKGEAEHEH
jgi:membrane fusion protein, heavy metal efflux system